MDIWNNEDFIEGVNIALEDEDFVELFVNKLNKDCDQLVKLINDEYAIFNVSILLSSISNCVKKSGNISCLMPILTDNCPQIGLNIVDASKYVLERLNLALNEYVQAI